MQNFRVVLPMILYKDLILSLYDYSKESYLAVLPCGTVYFALQDGSNFLSLWMKTLLYDHSKESYLAVLPRGTVYYAVQGGSNFLSLWMKP